MNRLDKLIGYVAPAWGASRQKNRRTITAYSDITKGTRFRNAKTSNSSADSLTLSAGDSLRGQGRYLEQHYDLARGVLNVLVARIVGPTGIGIEPMPLKKDGALHKEFAKALRTAFDDWSEKPETTGEHDWIATQQLGARSLFRDGEFLAQQLMGDVPMLDHMSKVPFSLELLEADFLPYDLNEEKRGITQGVERNSWGRPRAYHVYKQHPGDLIYQAKKDTKRVLADRMLHPKMVDRFRQARGVSVFASVLTRLDDIKSYEESERVAARVAAAMAGFIKKGSAEDYAESSTVDQATGQRSLQLAPGMIFDDLQPGEDIGTIESNRPSALLTPFLEAMERKIALGTQTSYSSVSKNYGGTYSAQRQELVEQYINDLVIAGWFIGKFVRPVYKNFARMAIASGTVKVPDDVDLDTVLKAEYYPQPMLWIDPDKEAKAQERQIQAGLKSRTATIRERGRTPEQVRQELKTERDDDKADGLILSSDYANDAGQQNTETQHNNTEGDNNAEE